MNTNRTRPMTPADIRHRKIAPRHAAVVGASQPGPHSARVGLHLSPDPGSGTPTQVHSPTPAWATSESAANLLNHSSSGTRTTDGLFTVAMFAGFVSGCMAAEAGWLFVILWLAVVATFARATR